MRYDYVGAVVGGVPYGHHDDYLHLHSATAETQKKIKQWIQSNPAQNQERKPGFEQAFGMLDYSESSPTLRDDIEGAIEGSSYC